MSMYICIYIKYIFMIIYVYISICTYVYIPHWGYASFHIPHIIGFFHISIAHVRCLGRKHHRVGKPPLLKCNFSSCIFSFYPFSYLWVFPFFSFLLCSLCISALLLSPHLFPILFVPLYQTLVEQQCKGPDISFNGKYCKCPKQRTGNLLPYQCAGGWNTLEKGMYLACHDILAGTWSDCNLLPRKFRSALSDIRQKIALSLVGYISELKKHTKVSMNTSSRLTQLRDKCYFIFYDSHHHIVDS